MWKLLSGIGKLVLLLAVLYALCELVMTLQEWRQLGAEVRTAVRAMTDGVEGGR